LIETLGHHEALGQAIHREDPRRAGESGAHRRAEPDRPLREHRHGVADPDAAALRAAESGAHDVGAHQHLFVAEVIGNRGQIRHRIRDEHVFGLAAVDRVPEAPSAHGLSAALGLMATEAAMALATGRDGASDHALPDLVAGNRISELLDHADRLVSNGEAAGDPILAFENVNVGAADGGRGHSHERIARPDARDRLLLEHDASGLREHGGPHGAVSWMGLACLAMSRWMDGYDLGHG